MKRGFRGVERRLTAFGGAVAVVCALLALPATPAMANVTSEPVAIAVGHDGDSRVLQVGGDGKSNSSPIVMAPYASAASSTASRQRWNLERVTGSGMPAFAYRIKNPSTGKCLNASGSTAQNKAPVILYTCIGTAATKNEIWWMDSNPPPGGARFRSLRDNRCLDITGANTANNAATEVYTCVETDATWNQMFKTRTAGYECTVRDRDWQVTAGLCVSPAPAATGVISNWFNTVAVMSYRDPSTYALSNELRSRIMATVINEQGTETGDVQLGWRALREPTSAGTVDYNAFWQEYGANVEEYHAIPLTDTSGAPNGSGTPDDAQHTYMMLGSATTGQWDMYYDFNYVATTVRQSGGRADFLDVGVQSRYIDALSQPEPFQFRTQTMDLTGVWNKPSLPSTALGNDKECGLFPIWEDFTGGAGNNQPPWCLSTARTLTTDGSSVDTLVVSKPTTAVSVAPQPAAPTTLGTPKSTAGAHAEPATVNGVDQATLDACVTTRLAACLRTVPGLQRCVRQHLLCHGSATAAASTGGGSRRSTPLSATDAISVARAQLHTGAGGRFPQATRTVLTDTGVQNLASGYPADTAVYLVSGVGPVRSWRPGSNAVYGRWTAVISADTGAVLYARLDHRS